MNTSKMTHREMHAAILAYGNSLENVTVERLYGDTFIVTQTVAGATYKEYRVIVAITTSIMDKWVFGAGGRNSYTTDTFVEQFEQIVAYFNA